MHTAGYRASVAQKAAKTAPTKTAPTVRGGLSPTSYKRLVAFYMGHPAQHNQAAKATGLNYRTCRKAWEEGLDYDYARQPIRDIVVPANADLLALDRLEREAVAQEGGELPPAPPLTGSGDALNEEVVRNGVANLVRKRIAAMKLLERTQENAAVGQAMMRILNPSITELAHLVADRMDRASKLARERPDDPLGHGSMVGDGMLLLRAASEIGKTQAMITKLAVESEGLVLRDLRASLTTGDAFTTKQAEEVEEVDDATLLARIQEEEQDIPKRRARIQARLNAGSGQTRTAQHEVVMPASPPVVQEVVHANAGDDDADDDGELDVG